MKAEIVEVRRRVLSQVLRDRDGVVERMQFHVILEWRGVRMRASVSQQTYKRMLQAGATDGGEFHRYQTRES